MTPNGLPVSSEQNSSISLTANNPFINQLKRFIMAEFKLDGRMKVKSLKENFNKCFGATLRVYTTPACKQFADDNATLASIRAEGAKGGELTVGGNLRVGNFEDKIKEMYGIGVQVANKDNSKLADNSVTLVAAGK